MSASQCAIYAIQCTGSMEMEVVHMDQHTAQWRIPSKHDEITADSTRKTGTEGERAEAIAVISLQKYRSLRDKQDGEKKAARPEMFE